MIKKTIESIKNDYKVKIDKNYESYIENLANRTKSQSNFITINELEKNLCDVKRNNDNLYNNLTSEILKNINEEELIDIKKRI